MNRLAQDVIQTGISSGASGDASVILQTYTDDAGNTVTVYGDGSFTKTPPAALAAGMPDAGGLSGMGLALLVLLGVLIVPNLFSMR